MDGWQFQHVGERREYITSRKEFTMSFGKIAWWAFFQTNLEQVPLLFLEGEMSL